MRKTALAFLAVLVAAALGTGNIASAAMVHHASPVPSRPISAAWGFMPSMQI